MEGTSLNEEHTETSGRGYRTNRVAREKTVPGSIKVDWPIANND